MSPIKKIILICLLPVMIAGVYSVSTSISRDSFASSTQDLKDKIDTDESYEKVYLLLTSLIVAGALLANISLHMLYYQTPNVQGRILAIVVLPCVYALSSYIGLSMTRTSALAVTFLDAITEAYSAFALLMFFDLLCAYFVSSVNRDLDHLPEKRVIHNRFPIYLLQPYEVDLNASTTRLYRKYTYQYLIIRLVGSCILITMIAADIVPVLGGYLFLLVSFISGYIALLAVWTFYTAVKKEISDHKPGHKFFCLKASVFFSFSQMYFIRGIHYLGFFVDLSPFKLQNYLMLGEMALISIFMVCYYFPKSAAPQNKDVEMARHSD